MERTNKDFINTIQASLIRYWRTVVVLDQKEGAALFQRFTRCCVVDHMTAKFLREFNSRKPITQRFFREYAIIDVKDRLEPIFGMQTPAPMTARVLWGSSETPICLLLGGTSSTAHSIFVSEGDAIAEVASNKRVRYMFLSGATGDLFFFPRSVTGIQF